MAKKQKIMSSGVNIEELNDGLSNSFIHINLDRIDYTLSDAELILLENAGSSLWKDVALAGIGIGIPCLLNGLFGYLNSTVVNLDATLFINFLIGGIFIVIGIVALVFHKKTSQNFKSIIAEIRSKPKYKMPTKN